jgi:hypothetical protein
MASMGQINGTSRGKKKAPKQGPDVKVSHCTLAEAEARNPGGYTVAFQDAPDAPFLFLKTGELVEGRWFWRFVKDVDDAGLWDLKDCAKLLLRVRDDIPHAVAVAVV